MSLTIIHHFFQTSPFDNDALFHAYLSNGLFCTPDVLATVQSFYEQKVVFNSRLFIGAEKKEA